jgi:hypothetical protein
MTLSGFDKTMFIKQRIAAEKNWLEIGISSVLDEGHGSDGRASRASGWWVCLLARLVGFTLSSHTLPT